MTHSIILAPATIGTNIKLIAKNLGAALVTKNVRTASLEFATKDIEQLLADGHKDDLLLKATEQRAELTDNNDLILIHGLPLAKPYAAELNFDLALSLNAAIIFVTTTEQEITQSLQQLKIVSTPYQTRYKQTVLGAIFDHPDDVVLKDSSLLNMPIIGSSNNNFDFTPIQKFLDEPNSERITPAAFKHYLITNAKRANKKIVLPEGEEPRTIEAANVCATKEIAECILLGNKNKINDVCNQLKLTLHQNIIIIDPKDVIEKYVAPLYKARRTKGLTEEDARKQLEDTVMLGTMMLQLGEVDGLVSGAIHTTANTIRPPLQIIKTPPNVKLVSSVFFMCLPDQVTVFADCAINPNPSPEGLADIAIQSADSAKAFGIDPKVAMLSYSTGASGFGEDVDKIISATETAKKLRPDLNIEGPIQYDAAVSETTAKLKLPNSKVAGHATVFIMPSLNVGNITAKAVQRSTDIVCIGPMLQGLKKPVNDLSRGCSVEDIVFTIALTAIQGLNK